MNLAEILASALYLTDAEGKRKAIQLDLAVWQEILALLESGADVRRRNELFIKSPDVLARLADEARAERIRAQNEHALKMLKDWMAERDDMGEDWWDEFEAELRQNHLTFPEREMDYTTEREKWLEQYTLEDLLAEAEVGETPRSSAATHE